VTTCTDEGKVMLDWVSGGAGAGAAELPLLPAHADMLDKSANAPDKTQAFAKTESRNFIAASRNQGVRPGSSEGSQRSMRARRTACEEPPLTSAR
jgi:hypothetical protein